MKKLLIIEDSIHTSVLLKRYLEKNNFEIIMARDGVMGLEKVKTEKPDLIILDIILPKLDGYQVARKLKDDPETKDIPIIGISGGVSGVDVKKVYEAGMDDYMTKPFDIYEFRRRVLNRLNP